MTVTGSRLQVHPRYSIRSVSLPPTVAEYFAGIGLVRMGLESRGWSVVFANDISHKKFEMYNAFYPDADQHYVVGDVYDLEAAGIPTTTLATCSFPCIDLSVAGNRNGIHGRHSSVFWGFVRVLTAQGAAAPPIVLVENVPGWLYSNKGEDFRLTVQSLNDLGYLCDVFTLDALRFVPQSRLRVFLVGTRLPVSQQNLPSRWDRPSSLMPEVLRSALLATEDLGWFKLALPDPPSLLRHGLSNLVEKLPDSDPRWWAEEEVKRHFAMMSPSHQGYVQGLVASETAVFRTFYRRKRTAGQRAEVRSDDVAGCLRTAVGGSGKQFLVCAGQGRLMMRTMTAREYARLQGVPDSYPISVDGVQALTGFGDAVCVPAISWIAEHALNPLVTSYLPGVRLEQQMQCLTI